MGDIINREHAGRRDLNLEWEERMREKEIGMDLLLQQLEEERERVLYAQSLQKQAEEKTDAMRKKCTVVELELKEEIKARDEEIEVLKEEINIHKAHTLREIAKQKEIEEIWKLKVEEIEERERDGLAGKDEIIATITALKEKAEGSIRQRSLEIADLKKELEDLGVELEDAISIRERLILGLKQEVTSLKSSYEEIIAQLRDDYENLLKKYQTELGAGGIKAAH